MALRTQGRRRNLHLGLLLVTAFLRLVPAAVRADPAATEDRPAVVVVMGAAGTPEYGTNFLRQLESWKDTVERASAQCLVVGDAPVEDSTDRDLLQRLLQAQTPHGSQPLWLVLIGHGTFDGKVARFNLRGPDVSPTELADWLQPFTRPLVIINTASASAPFLSTLTGTNRVIVTATRSGEEQNYARFGEHLAEAFGNPNSDLDRDDQVSLLEAFLTASAEAQEFYKTEGRLATEHALLDDNGDGKGTPAEWFRGVRAVQSAKEGKAIDGARSRQLHLVLSPEEQALSPGIRVRRDDLERSITNLRNRKAGLDETEYYRQLETLLLELARVYRSDVQPDLKPARP